MFCFTSTLGLHNLTTGSIPLVARRHWVGWGWRQFTMESSPLNTLTIFVVSLSQMKNEPSSDPATTYWPLLKIDRHTSIILTKHHTRIILRLNKYTFITCLSQYVVNITNLNFFLNTLYYRNFHHGVLQISVAMRLGVSPKKSRNVGVYVATME